MTTAPATDELRQHLEDYRSSGSVYLPNVVESAIKSCTDDALIGELARRGRWLIEQPGLTTLAAGWRLLSCEGTDDGRISWLMAARVIDGIGVIATWSRPQTETEWTCWVVDTEGGQPRTSDDDEYIPPYPPVTP